MADNNTKKALVLGDNERAVYHPLKNMASDLVDILDGSFTGEFTENAESLVFANLQRYDLLVSYSDNWDVKLLPEQSSGIMSFVAGGGGFLSIHTGISLQKNYEIAQLMGARFTGHPPYDRLPVWISDKSHPIMDGIEDFEVDDEPYQFAFDPFTEKTVLMEYGYKDSVYPAAWASEYCEGRVVYLMPGHDNGPFKNPAYRRLIRNSALWLTREI